MRLPKKLKSLKTIQIFSLLKEEGAALIVTLLVMLVLVLLGLSLLLQSDTEHAIAMNDQDANEALHYAEAQKKPTSVTC